MSGRCAIFIDGGYMEKILKDLGEPQIDYNKMVESLSIGHDLLRVYYYNCLPYQPNAPTAEDSRRFANKQRFFQFLNSNDYMTVREGKLEKRGTDADGRGIFVQKRVDVYLATDLVMLSTKRTITDAIMFAGDSDFIPAIEVAKAEGVIVQLLSVKLTPTPIKARPHNELVQCVDKHRILEQDELLAWQRLE